MWTWSSLLSSALPPDTPATTIQCMEAYQRDEIDVQVDRTGFFGYEPMVVWPVSE